MAQPLVIFSGGSCASGTHFPGKSSNHQKLPWFSSFSEAPEEPGIAPGAMSARNCPCQDSTTQLIINFVTCCAEKVRFFKGGSSPLRPLCASPAPPNTTQAHPVVFQLLVPTDGHRCRPDGFLRFPTVLFAVCYLHSLVTCFPLLCNSSHACPLLCLQLALRSNKITTRCKSWEPSCCKACDRERTRHSQTEIPWLHWNLNSHFHSFWWAHSLWQRNQLSSAFSGS